MDLTENTSPILHLGNTLRVAHRLVTNQWMLFLSLVLLSAIFLPYAGITHDARLYAVQTIDRVNSELHAEDLYLKYGSQDNYSVFSWLTYPLVNVLGIPTTFFLLYLGGNLCWLWALQRFVQTLLRQRVAALGALCYLAVNSIAFGGYEIFHINENFLTPRIWAVAFVVLGLERLIRNKYTASFAWIAFAILLHPLMGFGGLCVWLIFRLTQLLKPLHFSLLMAGGLAGVAVVLLNEPLGAALFGIMDDQWREYVLERDMYCVTTQWCFSDWSAIISAFATITAGRLFIRMKPNVKRLLDAVMLIAAIGLIVATVAMFLPYKLLLQGQAYRAVWLVQLIQIPMLFALLEQWLRRRLSPTGNWVLLAILLIFAASILTLEQIVAAGLLLAAANWWHRAKSKNEPARAVILRRFAWVSLIASLILSILMTTKASDLIRFDYCRPMDGIAMIPETVGPFVCWIAAVLLLVIIHRLLKSASHFKVVAISGFLVIQTAFFIVRANNFDQYFGAQEAKDSVFVENYLQNMPLCSTRTPTLYWPMGPLDDIWIRMHCNSYYTIDQTAGNIFNRETASEGHRRAMLTRAFELDARKRWLLFSKDAKRQFILNVFRKKPDSAFDTSTLEDFLNLCSDKNVDLVVLSKPFRGLYEATNGSVFIYDAHSIRAMFANLSNSHLSHQ